VTSAPSGILVCSERPEVAAELLAAARALAESTGERVSSLMLGPDSGERARQEIAQGADEVVIPLPGVNDRAGAESLTALLAGVVGSLAPATVLVGSTRTGAEAAARLAQRLGVACATECLALEREPNSGALLVERYVYGGRFVSRQSLHSRPHIAAVQPKRFEPLTPDPRREGAVRELPVPLPAGRVTVVAVRERARSSADIGRAEVIVTAGRGVRTREDLAVLEPLARALGGELAGTRPLVERAWFPVDRQVGLSGRTVRPRLYVACGVSGQIEHITGMRSARTVVAINLSPDAPIHREADYTVVGDLYEIVPALVAAIQAARQSSASTR
jgi:electron transfer flavoprotein alpha subunit